MFEMECRQHVKVVLDLLTKLGFIIRPEKCTLTPSTKFVYLGNVWDTANWTVGIKEKREISIRNLASKILKQETVGVRKFSRLLGKIRSTADALPLARARCRAMAFDFSAICKRPEDYSKHFIPSDQARTEMEYWASLPVGLTQLISPKSLPVFTLNTDASSTGYGWYWKNTNYSASFTESWMSKHINVKELYALRQFLVENQGSLENCLLCWRVDNSVALAAVKK